MQVYIEGWPTLLTDEAACRYLSIERAPFARLVEAKRVSPVEVEPGTWRWRKNDLDKMIKWLPLTTASNPEVWSNLAPNEAIVAKIADAVVAKVASRLVAGEYVRPQALSILETARILGIGRSRVYELIGENRLQVRKIGRRTLVLMESVDSLFR